MAPPGSNPDPQRPRQEKGGNLEDSVRDDDFQHLRDPGPPGDDAEQQPVRHGIQENNEVGQIPHPEGASQEDDRDQEIVGVDSGDFGGGVPPGRLEGQTDVGHHFLA